MLRIRYDKVFYRLFSTKDRNSPFKGLPFKYDKKQAYDVLKKEDRMLDTNFQHNTQVIELKDKFTARFIPFHAAKVTGLNSKISGKYFNGNNSGSYSVTGDMWDAKYEIQVYAGFNYPRDHVEAALKLSSHENIKYLTYGDLEDCKGNKIILEAHDMTLGYALEKIVHILHNYERERAVKLVKRNYKATKVEIQTLVLDLSKAKIEVESFFLPAYIYEYEGHTNKLYKIVNGFDGRVNGPQLYSPWKMFAHASLFGLLGMIGPHAPMVIVARVMLGGFASGMAGAIWASLKNINLIKTLHDQTNSEYAYNQKFKSTNEDIKRKKETNYFNDNNSDSPPDSAKYILLGLSPHDSFTLAELKAAYHAQIKQWHPDQYTGDKIVAKNMSIQINEAYTFLKQKAKC